MAKLTDGALQISIPFAVPFLGINEPTSLSINKTQLQFIVRVIVVLCSALLFWPKIKSAFGFTNTVSEDQTQDIQDRIAKLEHEREERQGMKGRAVVVGSSGSTASTPVLVASGKDKGNAKRRKA